MNTRQAGEILPGFEKGTKSISNSDEIATLAATAFLQSCDNGQDGETIFLDLLFAMAHGDDENITRPATSILYHEIIEKLCDDFTPHSAGTANQVLLYLLTKIRDTQAGKELDQILRGIGYPDTAALTSRHHSSLENKLPVPTPPDGPMMALIPSRVTVGADIAITSIIINRLRTFYPDSELIIVGPGHIPEIFSNLPNVSHIPFEIKRGGNLKERFLFWPYLFEKLTRRFANIPADKILVVDPESRLTQLGLLPLCDPARTLLFPSRSLEIPHKNVSLSAITNHWLDQILGDKGFQHPSINPPASSLGKAAGLCDNLRENGCRKILLVNFGVGRDDRKKLSADFELQLILRILKRENTIILLDMGCGSEEKVRAAELVSLAAQQGIVTSRVTDLSISGQDPMVHGLISVRSSIGDFAALAMQADCYIGYDSCGQHLAAASNTPTVTIFAGHPNPRFIDRWTPLTRDKIIKAIPVETDRQLYGPDFKEVIEAACRAVNDFFEEEHS
ncbi:MAG: glycosyltransferase family 9 protein [Thermodesulfobacteriota bacterium]